MSFDERSERVRRQLLARWKFRLYLWAKLPLAACAGLRLVDLDTASCTVSLPGGWRTQNPFRSTYFAAQAMAAEMSTGAPAGVLVGGAAAVVAMLVREVRGVFTKRAVGTTFFKFDGVAEMSAVIEKAAASGESEVYVARSAGRQADGSLVSEFDITWSFKRRG